MPGTVFLSIVCQKKFSMRKSILSLPMGVEMIPNTKIGEDLSFETVQNDFDAISSVSAHGYPPASAVREKMQKA